MFSIWEQQSFFAPADVIIVGAGLMGLWSAWELKQRNGNLRITILERGTLPTGASTRNAGFACFGSPTELIHDAQTSGVDAMLELVETRYKGIAKIRSHFNDDTIGFDPCGGYECINQAYAGWDVLDEKMVWLNSLLNNITGNPSTLNDATEKLAGIGLQRFDRLIENVSEAALHSGKLVQALTQKVQSCGVTILYGTEFLDAQPSGDGLVVRTNQNISIAANKLLFCTNAFTSLWSDRLPVQPARGQVIVTSPIEGLAMKGTFHYDEGFYYWRNLGNRILLGGARNTDFAGEATTDMNGSEHIKQALIDFLKEHLDPCYQYTIDHHWSGIMGFTQEKAPFVGSIGDNHYAAIACNGMGVALTPMIAERVAEMVL